jgi:hypothetical protein
MHTPLQVRPRAPRGPVLIGILSLLAVTRAAALSINSYAATDHDRFLNFPDEATTHNPDFLWATTDLTGVGYDSKNASKRQFTLVSPLHFVAAWHFRPTNPGTPVYFINSDGNRVTRDADIAAGVAVPNPGGGISDLYLGKLTSPAPASVSFLPYLNLPGEADYLGEPILAFGTVFDAPEPRVGIGELDLFTDTNPETGLNTSRVFRFRYNENGASANECFGEVGDSGSPSVVLTGGRAALVGVHSYIEENDPPGPNCYVDTFDVFVPHYVDELNALMAADGYHMTAANPGTAALALSAPVPPLIRQGSSFSLPITLASSGPDTANNLNLINTVPPGLSLNSYAGTDWFLTSNTGGVLTTRKAGLVNGDDTTFTLEFTADEAGTWSHTVSWLADESSVATTTLTIQVIESYPAWSASLADSSFDGDDDGDGIGNLFEYAVGGDPAAASQFQPATGIPLLPEIFTSAPGVVTLRHLRRTDAGLRGLTYSVQSSPVLAPPAFVDASGLILDTRETGVNDDFEQVEYDFVAANAPLFLRVRVILDESL